MSSRSAVLIAAVGAALALPGNAAAVDHVTLFVAPSKLTADWKLSAAVVGPTAPRGRETFGVTLTRKLANGRGEEQHGLRAAPAGTITFDGRSGRWRARFGTLLTIGMTVTATGPAQEIGESLGCRGAFARVPVVLRGTFALRTGTTFFGTIRRVRLTGSVTFNRGGPVDCAPAAATTCCAVDRAHRRPPARERPGGDPVALARRRRLVDVELRRPRRLAAGRCHLVPRDAARTPWVRPARRQAAHHRRTAAGRACRSG